MATRGGEKQIPVAEIDKELRIRVESADLDRAAAMDDLRRVREVKASILEREQSRLAVKLGEKDPRVRELRERVKANAALVQGLAVEAARAEMPLPTANKNAWILHGHVFEYTFDPAVNLVVALFNRRGSHLEGAGKSTTDSAGHFEIEVTRGKEGQLDSAANQVFVQILDQKGETLYTDKRALNPELGKVDYIEIVLPHRPLKEPAQKTTPRPNRAARKVTDRSKRSK